MIVLGFIFWTGVITIWITYGWLMMVAFFAAGTIFWIPFALAQSYREDRKRQERLAADRREHETWDERSARHYAWTPEELSRPPTWWPGKDEGEPWDAEVYEGKRAAHSNQVVSERRPTR